MLAGSVLGIILNFFPSASWLDTWGYQGVFKVGGQLFIRMFQLVVVPVVFVSLVNGIVAMDNPAFLGRIGLKLLFLYLATALISIAIASVITGWINPGLGLNYRYVADAQVNVRSLSLADTIINILPANIFAAFSSGNMLQIIFLAVIFGLAIIFIRGEAEEIIHLFRSLDRLNMELIKMILYFAPVGVFCLMVNLFGQFGWSALLPLLKYLLCIGVSYVVLFLCVFMPMLRYAGKVSPLIFFKKYFPVLLIAFSSSSSNVALPINIGISVRRLGIPKKIATFALSLGATINMNGTAIMQIVAVKFLAQAYGIPLTGMQYCSIVATVLLASVGTAGMPSAGVVMLGAVLGSAGMPMGGIALIMGIDRIVDMFRTSVNVCGDTVCALVLSRNEGVFSDEIFNAKRKRLI